MAPGCCSSEIGATDLLYTNQDNFVLKQVSIDAIGARRNDTKRFGLNLRYNSGFRENEETDE